MENPFSDLPLGNDECRIALERDDVYPKSIIPDEDVETCLKVIRSLRNWALDPEFFDADAAIILSHAHAVIYTKVKAVQELERIEQHTASLTRPAFYEMLQLLCSPPCLPSSVALRSA